MKGIVHTLLALVLWSASQAIPAAGVLQHHNDAARSGHYTVPDLTYERAANLHRDPRFDGRVAGAINAQPLYWHGTNGRGLIIVATEDNWVAALDAATGERVWQRQLGPPAPRSSLPCGNISPLGVTGTPVIDSARRALYLDAMVLTHGQPRHKVFGLALADGTTLPGWPVDVQQALSATGVRFAARLQNQRGALAILKGRVYVPYGGHYGDCGAYRGWVVGLALDQPGRILAFATRAQGGGIWAPGGIAVSNGALFAATGNTFGANVWQDGEAVLRLPPDLRFTRNPRDYFTPADWRELDASDLDLGGSNPLPLTVTGATPSRLILALGKDGKAYLLDRANLGGVGGALRAVAVARGPIRTAPATYVADGAVFVVFHGNPRGCPVDESGDLAALRIGPGSQPSIDVAWCAAAHGRGAPMVTSGRNGRDPIVWIVGAEGDNRLRGFRGDSGAAVFDGRGTEMRTVAHFQTPIAAAGRIYVAADGRVYAFTY